MTVELETLYQEVILDHAKHPRNFRALASHTSKAEGYNPLCGDRFTVYLTLENNQFISSIAFMGSGCAISTASASLMTERLTHKTVNEARELFDIFHRSVTSMESDNKEQVRLGKLRVLLGVRKFPTRIKCATLAWHALMDALPITEPTLSMEYEHGQY